MELLNIFEQIGFDKNKAKELLERSHLILELQKRLDTLNISGRMKKDIQKGNISKFTASELQKLLGE